MVIVYRSNTGFTKEYAQMLGRAEKLKVYELDQAREQEGQEVFYMGPVMAGHITGVDQAVKRFKVAGTCGVGISPATQQTMDTLVKANYTGGAPLFYLQGGWDPKKVGWLKRRMVGMVTRSTREQLQDKGSRRTPEEDAYYAMLVRGGSCVAYENLNAIREWLAQR